jgi:hypothetical protein
MVVDWDAMRKSFRSWDEEGGGGHPVIWRSGHRVIGKSRSRGRLRSTIINKEGRGNCQKVEIEKPGVS